MHVLEWAFVAGLALWIVLSVLRFVGMYRLDAPVQAWRRWDVFHLVPVGAFFSPNPPPTDLSILVRDHLSDHTVTPWTEVPTIRPRRLFDVLWSPQKHVYKAKLDVARNLLAAARRLSAEQGNVPVSLVISDPYVALLRHASTLPRLSRPLATQFAVVEYDILGGELVRAVISSVHRL